MANRPELASIAELDARLKRLDEPRWLASRYAPAAARRLLVAIGLLGVELRRALGLREAMLGRIRVQWWRESLEAIRDGAPPRRHDLVEELAAALGLRPDLTEPLLDALAAVDDILEEHLAAGHDDGQAHAARHFDAEARLTLAAGRALDPALGEDDAKALRACAEAHLARLAGLPEFGARWAGAQAAMAGVSAGLLPAVAHLGVSSRAGRNDSDEQDRPLARRWGVLRVVLLRRL